MLVKDKGRDIANPAHHGRHTRRGHAHLPHDGGLRSASPARLRGLILASSWCLMFRADPPVLLLALGHAHLRFPNSNFLSQLPARMDPRRDDLPWSSWRWFCSFLATLKFRPGGRQRSDPVEALRLRMMASTRACSKLQGHLTPLSPGRARTRHPRFRPAVQLRPGAKPSALVAPFRGGQVDLSCIWRACLSVRTMAGRCTSMADPAGDLGDEARTAIRRNDIGFVYQFPSSACRNSRHSRTSCCHS